MNNNNNDNLYNFFDVFSENNLNIFRVLALQETPIEFQVNEDEELIRKLRWANDPKKLLSLVNKDNLITTIKGKTFVLDNEGCYRYFNFEAQWTGKVCSSRFKPHQNRVLCIELERGEIKITKGVLLLQKTQATAKWDFVSDDGAHFCSYVSLRRGANNSIYEFVDGPL